jgi:nucleolar protein 15
MYTSHLTPGKVVDPTTLSADVFKGADRKFKALPWNKMERQEHNKLKTDEELEKNIARLVKADNKKRKAIAALGIDYEFSGFEGAKNSRRAAGAAAV